MPGRTNAGGGINPFAFIFATYPAGFVCICTDGSRTLRLKDTSGYGVFYPPYAGTWIVTATDPTDPTNTDSESVEITTEGQNVSVELLFIIVLYSYGKFNSTMSTGNWSANYPATITEYEDYIHVTGKTSYNAGGYGRMDTLIDFANYNVVKITHKAVKSTDNYNRPVLQVVNESGNVLASQTLAYNNVAETVELDISSINENGYVQIAAKPLSSYSGSATFTFTISELVVM